VAALVTLATAIPPRAHEALPDRQKLPLAFDPERLAADVAAFGDADWVPHFVRQNYEGTWSILPLRGPAGADHPVLMCTSHPGTEAYEDTLFLERAPYLREVLGTLRDYLGGPLLSARLLKLAPGALIREHTDPDLDAETVRLHVPVLTNDAVDFRLRGERVVMEAGSCWYLRLSAPHRVANRGTTHRIHLVVDVRVRPAHPFPHPGCDVRSRTHSPKLQR
jgi:hypothetical protein